MVSILIVTMNKLELTTKCVSATLSRADEEYELLVWDNGSKDQSVPDFMASLRPRWQYRSPENKGYAYALNQMLLRAKGEFLCVMDPDLVMPQNWLSPLIETYRLIYYSGITGIHTTQKFHDLEEHCGVWVRPTRVEHLAPKFYSRETWQAFGAYQEGFGFYAQEDIDCNYRVTKLGLLNYYLADMQGLNLGTWDTDPPEYRAFKNECVKKTDPMLQEYIKQYDKLGNYRITPPPMLDLPPDHV